jgi:uncharacterized protein YndB with AHSA1/START domain
MNRMTQDEPARRSPDVVWPAEFSPESADTFTHNEIRINAPRERVWRHLVAAENWPQWYPNAHRVRILDEDESGGELHSGSRFEWDTFGSHLVSRVAEFDPGRRLAWVGEAEGYRAYHVWLLADGADGCSVVTEEVGNGPGAVDARQADPTGMHKGHDLWLTRLKRLAEAASHAPAPIRR